MYENESILHYSTLTTCCLKLWNLLCQDAWEFTPPPMHFLPCKLFFRSHFFLFQDCMFLKPAPLCNASWWMFWNDFGTIMTLMFSVSMLLGHCVWKKDNRNIWNSKNVELIANTEQVHTSSVWPGLVCFLNGTEIHHCVLFSLIFSLIASHPLHKSQKNF